MFDTIRHDNAALPLPSVPTLQVVSVQIMPMGDGLLSVSLSGTYLDEETLEFVNAEFDGATVESIDEALIIVHRALADAFHSITAKEGH